MSDVALDGQPRRIPVFETFRESFRLAWNPTALRMPMLWLLIGLQIVAALISDPKEQMNYRPEMFQGHIPNLFIKNLIIGFGEGIIVFIVITSLSVSWMRYILCNENPSIPCLSYALWRYLGYEILIYLFFLLSALVFLIPPFIILFYFYSAHWLALCAGILLPIIWIGLIVSMIWGGVSLVPFLVGISIDDHDMTIKRSFKTMQGNLWNFLGLSSLIFLTYIPPTVILGLFMIVSMRAAGWFTVVNGILSAAITTFYYILNASMMALVYRRLVPAHPQPPVFDA
jgi:hypothetical protein